MTGINEPGVYSLPVERYHADPVEGGSLRASGARLLLPPSCPARFRHERDHGRSEHKAAWDLGHAAHLAVLGAGPEVVRVNAPDWRTKRAQQQRDEAYARGAVPVLEAQWQQVEQMAAALRRHPLAGRLLDPDRMEPEQTMVWRDPPTGVWLRAMVDALPRERGRGGRLILADYKTTGKTADPEVIGRAMADWGYHLQAAWYADGAAALGLGDDVRCLLIVQEVTPPYLVTVAEPDLPALRIGRRLARSAIDLYAQCTRDDHWPAYAAGPGTTTDTDLALVSLPAWEIRKHEEDW